MNRLAHECSPYLLLHKDQPVDWYPWGQEALEKARREDKPIFLSIGYLACHWCHVMARESFDDPEIAGFLNEHFVPVKVDREERPDVDHTYMSAVILLTGNGGWPLSVFLTPEGLPFWGGTYFPKKRRYGMPSFPEVLEAIHRGWREKRDSIKRESQAIFSHLMKQREAIRKRERRTITPKTLHRAFANIELEYDGLHGGWHGGPKFPQPMVLEFLLTYHRETGEERALAMTTQTLKAMARGGMYDQLGGGFHRYSVDSQWMVPHFEKMLYDNALLARVYLLAFQATGENFFREVGEETLQYVKEELAHPQGGFFSSQGAESRGKEGAYYLWSREELEKTLGRDFKRFMDVYGIHPFPGAKEGILFLKGESILRKDVEPLRKRLLAERQKREAPPIDDKVLTSWNGLMISSLSLAGRVLGDEWLELAEKCARFVLTRMISQDGELLHQWREGASGIQGFLSDYAHFCQGLLDLYQTTGEISWLLEAKRLMGTAMEPFQDPSWGFFDTSVHHEPLIMRPKEVQDNAIPCGNSMAARVMARLHEKTKEPDYKGAASCMLEPMGEMAAQYPLGFAHWLVTMADLLQGRNKKLRANQNTG